MRERVYKDWAAITKEVFYTSGALLVVTARFGNSALREMGDFSYEVGNMFARKSHAEMAVISRGFGLGFHLLSVPIKAATEAGMIFLPEIRRRVQAFS